MSGEDATVVEAKSNQSGGGGKRERSKIGFPYTALTDAIEVADAIHKNVGSGECVDVQLATWLKQSPHSSGYRVRLYAARMFGVIETIPPGQHKLTKLGFDIIDSNKDREAKIGAFLNVPLFKAIYDKWNGRQLPPAAGLEREMIGLGVAEKQKERARQVFERSAQQAGFFEHGKDRLVKPGIKPDEKPPIRQKPHFGGSGSGNGAEIDPAIQGLVRRLPPPDSQWPHRERVKWLLAVANTFELIYEPENDGDLISVTLSRPSSE